MVKVVINTGSCFNLTYKAVMRYAEIKGIKLTAYKSNPVTHLYVMWEPTETNHNTGYLKDLRENIIPKSSPVKKYFSIYGIYRDDPALIQVVEELKESERLELKIVEVPDDVKWKIEADERGLEYVREVSRCWK